MLKLLKFLFVLFLGVISCACVNMVAVHELNSKASDYLEEGDINSAISRLEASIDLDGKVYESRYNLASAYLQIGKNKEALEHIKVAMELQKNEPIVFYTYAVAAMKVADEIYEKKNKDGQIVPVEFKTDLALQKAAEQYVDLLTKANSAFNEYLELAPNAEDTQQIFDAVNDNEQKIKEKAEQYGIALEE
ncbi:MAG: tetratricopeptide repeat protein [Candidatus Gastranaerophilales bacterium]|nr:tetratricopeptide repeat protein [Candidatus Gastranaerophilales bacterium]